MAKQQKFSKEKNQKSKAPLSERSQKKGPAEKAATDSSLSTNTKSEPKALQPRSLNTIRFRNREFSGSPRRFANRKLDILPDMPDIRDRIYSPTLRALHQKVEPPPPALVRDQGNDSSCTGYSLAHVIDLLQRVQAGDRAAPSVSARMLYEMAKRNDEWNGSAYEGSSLRGAIKGFFRNGVCTEKTAPDKPGVKNWALTYEMAKEARQLRLGAYYRLQPDISDYHAAINEVGVIYVSAQIHSNWETPKGSSIDPGGKPAGGHAFAIIGYDEAGFWVLNSWGPKWGKSGLAHWTYRDWMSSVMDAWVLQLGVRAPDAFGVAPRASPGTSSGFFSSSEPNRSDILGHFINIDDGRFVEEGKYASPTLTEMQETVKRIVLPTSNSGMGFDHLVIYAHGGLNSLADEAKRIATWKRADIFGRNRIYNFHLMWGSGFVDEVFGGLSDSPTVGGVRGKWNDWIFEAGLVKEAGSYAWRNMKQDAAAAFGGDNVYNGGVKGLKPLLQGIDKAAKRPKLHLVGHSAGAIMLGRMLLALKKYNLAQLELTSIHLMAPACTSAFFNEHYGPYLVDKGQMKLHDKIYLYNLTDELELSDTVSSNLPLVPSYGRSLLYLVSRAFEEKAATPLAGMALYADKISPAAKLNIAYSAKGGKTESTSHGGFDNDAATMTTIMSRILGAAPKKPPEPGELNDD